MEFKRCSKCGATKFVSEFNIKNSDKNLYVSYCKDCNKAYQRKHYQENKQKYFDKAKRNDAKVRDAIRNIKASNPCFDCHKFYDWVCMDFDHLDSSQKDMNIAEMLHLGCSLERVMKEIEKCELVCSNCHRLRTKKRRTLTKKEPL